MATEKINDGETIQVTSQVNEIQSSKIILEKESKSKKNKYIFCSIFLFIFLLAFFRIPYVGSYIDSIFFEYLFGQMKFVIYGYIFFILILNLFSIKFRKIFQNKRFFLSFFVLIFAGCISISVINNLIVNSGLSLEFVSTMINYNTIWFDKSLNSIDYSNYICQISGGLIGEFFVAALFYVNYVLVMILVILLLVLSILIFTNNANAKLFFKIKKFFVHALGGEISPLGINELLPDKNDVKPQVIQKHDIEIEANKADQDTPPLTFLTDTGIDNYFINKNESELINRKLSKFFKKNGYFVVYKKTIIMPLFFEIHYEFSKKEEINDLLKQQSAISTAIGIQTFNINFKNNIVWFEIKSEKPSKISLKNILMSIPNNKKMISAIGIDRDSQPLTLDFNTYNNVCLIGKKGSGSIMLQSIIIASMAYMNTPNDLNMILIAPEIDKSLLRFGELPHLSTNVSKSPNEALNALIDIKSKIIERQRKLEEMNVNSIDEYNNKIDLNLKIPKIFVVISGYDQLIKSNIQCLDIIADILSISKKVGIYTLLSVSSVNNETLNSKIYSLFNLKLILKVETEYESMRLFDSYRANQLYGNGDGIMIDKLENVRFQSCYLNQVELNQIIEIIKTFNDSREK